MKSAKKNEMVYIRQNGLVQEHCEKETGKVVKEECGS